MSDHSKKMVTLLIYDEAEIDRWIRDARAPSKAMTTKQRRSRIAVMHRERPQR